MSSSKTFKDSERLPVWPLWLAGVCGVLLVVAVNGGISMHDASQSGKRDSQRSSSIMPKDPFKAYMEAERKNQAPPAENQVTVQIGQIIAPQNSSTFAPRNNPTQTATNKEQGLAVKPTGSVNPFTAAIEASKQQVPASPIVPFAR